MLGAEGVKNLVIDRLTADLETAITAVAHKFGAAPGEIPYPKAIHPSQVPTWDVPTSGYPYVTVNAEGTDGEISNSTVTLHQVVTEFKLGYTIAIVMYTQSPGPNGEPLARLQAERLALAIRLALLWELQLTEDDNPDQARIDFRAWGEDYRTDFDKKDGNWLGRVILMVPVVTVEALDTAPFIDREVRYEGAEVYAQNPVTGDEVPGTRDDPYDPRPYQGAVS